MLTINKMLFPHVQEPTRTRQVRALFLTLAIGVICASAVLGLIVWAYYSDRFRI
jgi:hypothetical protein